jgi:hypothetical protein
MQRIIRYFKDELAQKDVDMNEVARWAVARGWPLPKPTDPIERLAQEFSKAAREEIRHDSKTGKPYRANHAITFTQDNRQTARWFDIDEDPPRPKMLKSLVQRREQMVGDGLQLALDASHWNGAHPKDEPIQLSFDFTLDIEWRKNAPDADEDVA